MQVVMTCLLLTEFFRINILCRSGEEMPVMEGGEVTDSRQTRERIAQLKASVRAKVAHPFHIVTNRFGQRKGAIADRPRTRPNCCGIESA